MQKKLLFIFLSIFMSAQAQLDYALTYSNSTYTELSGSTDVSVNAWTSVHTMSMPFEFKYFGQKYNNIYITFDGFYFSDTGDDYIFYGTDNFKPKGNIPTESPISYLLTGSSPNRILKIQYKNINESTVDLSLEYSLNTQIWLYEASNIIEYHFGSTIITDPSFTYFYIGLIDYDNSPYLSIDSSAKAPVLVRVINAGTFNGISSYPSRGQVYTLTPKRTSVTPENILPYTFAQGANTFAVQCSEEYKLKLLDINGRDISNYLKFDIISGKYSLSGCASGMYILNIELGNQIFTEKILQQ